MTHVHFAEGSPMSDGAGPFGDSSECGALSVNPIACLTFITDGQELSSTVILTNNDEKIPISYKMKTTSPEKFRVRPSAGVLAPGDTVSVTLTILPGFQLGGLTRDKFLVMSMPVQQTDMSSADLAELWKNTAGKNVTQHKLRCIQTGVEITKNGSAIRSITTDNEQNQLTLLTSSITKLAECQSRLHEDVKRLNHLQWVSIILVVALAIVTYLLVGTKDSEHNIYRQCPKV